MDRTNHHVSASGRPAPLKTGQLFYIDNEPNIYMLVSPRANELVLVNLSTGNRWSEPVCRSPMAPHNSDVLCRALLGAAGAVLVPVTEEKVVIHNKEVSAC